VTRSEALAEARRRWPDDVTVTVYESGTNHPAGRHVISSFSGERERGRGPSWEAAFADADARAAKEGAR
jgi:hypothetical protein